MGSEGAINPRDVLAKELRAAGHDTTRVVAVLWTWLETYLLDYGSLDTKGPEISEAAARWTKPTVIDDKTLRWLDESPLLNAATLLARIGAYLERRTGTHAVDRTRGIEGRDVIVAWREPSVAAATHRHQYPPSADEHPSLSSLAPRLVVCPVVEAKIAVQIENPEGEEWDYATALLRQWQVGKKSLSIHLDTLAEHGMSGWQPDESKRPVGIFADGAIKAADKRRCIAAARDAVGEAAKAMELEAAKPKPTPTPAVLLMPELAAVDGVRRALAKEIGRQDYPPALTVVGLYHRKPADPPDIPPDLAGVEPSATCVNEAVVLGPAGGELWRHRKISSASGRIPIGNAKGQTKQFTEHIRLGKTLKMVQTPIGMIAVIICLDAFTMAVRQRLAASPADFLLVPSLSPTTFRHRNSLQQLVQDLWGMAFVCNRASFPKKPGETVWNEEHNRSFWVLQRRALKPPPPRPRGEHASFVFELSDVLKAADA